MENKKKNLSVVGVPCLLPIPVTFSPSPLKGHEIHVPILSVFLHAREMCNLLHSFKYAEIQRKKFIINGGCLPSMFELA